MSWWQLLRMSWWMLLDLFAWARPTGIWAAGTGC